MDLDAGGRLHEGIDPIETGISIQDRYQRLWDEVTKQIVFTRTDRYLLEKHMRRLNELGFELADALVQFLASTGGPEFRQARTSRASGLTPF